MAIVARMGDPVLPPPSFLAGANPEEAIWRTQLTNDQ